MKIKNIIAAVVVLSLYPIKWFIDVNVWITDRLMSFVSFMVRWMKLWTGI
jgi:hypothetical protein